MEKLSSPLEGWLPEDLRLGWDQIWGDALSFLLESEPDRITWSLGKNNKFSVKSVYNAITRNDAGVYNKKIWKGKIPAKIKIFMWLMNKDNLSKRNWKGDPTCWFCNCTENISHLFFQCYGVTRGCRLVKNIMFVG